MKNTQLMPALLMPLLAWRLYLRFRRTVGRQTLHATRLVIGMVVFSLLLVVFALVARFHLVPLLSLVGGLLAGAAIGMLGLRLTRFEKTADGEFYTPNAYLGISISMVFIGRLIYRYLVIYQAGDQAVALPRTGIPSAITLLMFALTAGYYLVYYAGTLRYFKQARAAQRIA